MHTYDSGTFIVGSSGEIDVDYLFDGGWFRGELALFSVEGMEELTPGSTEFMLEAARRALTNSEQGRIVVRDELEGARFGADLPWERNFNTDPERYQGVQTYEMTPGDEVGVMLVQHTTVRETLDNPLNVFDFGKLPLFSIPEANLLGPLEGQFEFVDVDGNGTIGLEDVTANRADGDYNDMILQFVGMDGNFASLEDNVNPERDWRNTFVGQQLLEYTDDRVFNDGVFEVGESGEVIIDFLYDGGLYEGELGIFSLEGMNPGDVNSEAFMSEAIRRAQSNSTEGYIVLSDPQEGARFSADLDWERDFNTGEYLGIETFQMEPGDLFGMILVPNGTLSEGIDADESILSKDPLFSMAEANDNEQIQFATINDSDEGVVVGFEDDDLNRLSNQDYNDLIIAIEGASAPIGVPAVEDVIFPRLNWLEEPVGTEEILPYFDSAV